MQEGSVVIIFLMTQNQGSPSIISVVVIVSNSCYFYCSFWFLIPKTSKIYLKAGDKEHTDLLFCNYVVCGISNNIFEHMGGAKSLKLDHCLTLEWLKSAKG